MTDPVMYGIVNCDTVKRARAWMGAQGIACRFHDFKKGGVPDEALARWIQAVGWEALVNRKGTTWRKLDAATQAGVVDADSAAALMRTQASVIKRPVVEWSDGRVTVGFAQDAMADFLSMPGSDGIELPLVKRRDTPRPAEFD